MAVIRKGRALRMVVGITALVLLMAGGAGAVTLNSPTLLYPGSQINTLQPTPVGEGLIQNPATDHYVSSVSAQEDHYVHDNFDDNADGVYANTYTNTSLNGTYHITVSAYGTIDEKKFERQALTNAWVEQYPDLTLTSSDISFSNNVSLPNRNIGDSDASNASISAGQTSKASVSGTYIGAYLGCGSTDLSCENISEFNQKMGKPHSIIVRYVDIKDSENPAHWAWAEEVKRNRAMPMFVYDPWDGLDAINISDVEHFANESKGLGTTVFIVFGHEMNLVGYPWGNQPEKYRQKFEEVSDTFHRIAPDVKMVWLPNQNWGYPWGGTNYGDGYSEYYPEGIGVYGEYVDWVGLNFYDKDWDENNKVTPGFFMANIKSGQNNTDFYQKFAVGKNKSMLIGETGAFDSNKDITASGERKPLNETEEASYKNEWIEQVYNVSTLEEEFPRLNAIIYFHTDKTETIYTQNHIFTDIVVDYKIPESPNIYKTLISNSYFIGAENATLPTTSNVSISGFSFQPQNINVSAGTIVTWTNLDSVAHTVTSDTGLFDSGPLSTGQTFSRTFNTAGNYDYHCSIHPSMTGRVVVSAKGDVNRNGLLDTGDATLILRYFVDLPIPSEYNPILPIGDMNCNGILDTGDATLVLRDVVGLDIPRCWE